MAAFLAKFLHEKRRRAHNIDSKDAIKTIDVIDGVIRIPKELIKFPLVIKQAFLTEIRYKPNEFGVQTVRIWFKEKPQLPVDEIIINGERFKLNFIDTNKRLGMFMRLIEQEDPQTLMRIQCPNPDCPYKRNYNKPYTDEANDEFRISSWKELLPLGKIICPFCGSKMIWAIKGKIEDGGGSRVTSSPPPSFFEDKMMPPPAASPHFAGGMP